MSNFKKMVNNSLKKTERLKGKKAVADIFQGDRKKVSLPSVKAFYSIKHEGEEPARFGISVPKKRFKRAVDRNQIKRYFREAVRVQKHELVKTLQEQQKHLDVLIVCNCSKMPDFKWVETKVNGILTELIKQNANKDINEI